MLYFMSCTSLYRLFQFDQLSSRMNYFLQRDIFEDQLQN